MASPPLLARRRPVIAAVTAIIAAACLVVIVLGVRYAGERRPGRLDTAIDARVRHHLDDHLRFLHHIVAAADPASVIVTCAVLIGVFFFTGRRRAAALAALGPALAAGISEFVLKPLIDRRMHDSLAFPSGHTTGAVSVAIVVAVVLLGPSRPPWPAFARFSLSGLVMLAAVAVATALVGSGYHYATDTLGGFGVAIAVVLGVACAIDAVCLKSMREQPREGRARQPV
jgi:undecaprenyl-diphosphatase